MTEERAHYDGATTSLLDGLRERTPDRHPAALAAVEAAAARRESTVERLVADQFVTALDAAEAVGAQWGLEIVDLARTGVDPAAMRSLPLNLAQRHRVVVISADEHGVTVATSQPGDVVAIDDVRAATGREPRLVVAPVDDLQRALDRYSQEQNTLGMPESGPEVAPQVAVESEEPVIRYVAALLQRAVTSRASDVHVEHVEREVRVRFRIDGVLHEIESVPTGVMSALISRLKVMAALDIAERRMPQNGRISFTHEGRTVDIRLATLPTVRGEKAVLRVLDGQQNALELGALGLAERNLGSLRAALGKPHGLVLVTGPTGSGKSTTLYAALQEISRPEINIITVEDPVEYRLDGVNQMQINPKAGLTFAAALPAILRSDPDVLLVGEIRDRTTAQLAIEAALTGHLVLTTLHTNDAPSAVTRLQEMGIEPFLLGASLDMVVAQRLARRLCEWCKEEYAPDADELARLEWPHEHLGAPERLWRPVGCRMCAGTGYRGRIAVHEVMPASDRLEGLIVRGAPTHELRDTARGEGMQSLREDGFEKALAGATTPLEVLRIAR